MRPVRPYVPYLFLVPAFAVFGFAVLAPVVMTGAYSLTEWNGYGEMVFVGLGNYIAIASDALFAQSFLHIAIYILVTLVLEVAVGLVLAGVIAARPRGSIWFRVAIFTPVILPMVVVALLWRGSRPRPRVWPVRRARRRGRRRTPPRPSGRSRCRAG